MKEIDKIIGREDAERLKSDREYKDSVFVDLFFG